jgi:2',3'-cyclic-nucleotide 2'-phosphodiesterase (5'-nucleotidase family)
VFFDSAGVANIQAWQTGQQISADAACPANGSWTVQLSAGAVTLQNSIPCQ